MELVHAIIQNEKIIRYKDISIERKRELIEENELLKQSYKKYYFIDFDIKAYERYIKGEVSK